MARFRFMRAIEAGLALFMTFAAWGQEHESSGHVLPVARAQDPAGPVNAALKRSETQLGMAAKSPGEESTVAEARAQMYQSRLDLALRLKEQKSVKGAQEKLEEILQGAAPRKIKQTVLIELAVLAQEQGQLARAQQIYAQYVQRYPEDPDMPEILLRQGLLYRQLGAPSLAASKFYGVMNAALTIPDGNMARHRRLVLQAQTELAETYYLQGQYAEAADFLGRLLKLEEPDLNVAMVQYKLIRCLAMLGQSQETIQRGREFLERFPEFAEVSEVRFQLAMALKEQRKNTEGLAQLSELLNRQKSLAEADPARWRYWQQRVGNEVANQLYRDGDFVHALELYQTLSGLDSTPVWQFPVWYQMGLAYERLAQPAKAIETYQRITDRAGELNDESSMTLRSVLDMARWRADFLRWQAKASLELSLPEPNPAPPAAATSGHDRSLSSG